MNKVLVIIYDYYNDAEELVKELVITDTPEARQKIVNDWERSYIPEDVVNDFIKGIDNSVEFQIEGDWDDPTARAICIKTKDDALATAKKSYEDKVARINELFEED